jgi:hypothetical protein
MQGISSFSFWGYFKLFSIFFIMFKVFFFLFIAIFKKIYYAHEGYMVSSQMNMNNMGRQAYGVWKPPPHMPLTIAGA